MPDTLTAEQAILHPLQPLSKTEIETGVTILNESGKLKGRVSFSSVNLVEPTKSVVKTFVTGDSIRRVLRFLGVDEQGSFDARVDVSSGELLEVRRQAGVQAPLSGRDFIRAIKITKADPAWQRAVRKRGIDDFERIQIDMWPGSGPLVNGADPGHRLVRAIAFVRHDKTDNGYARPLHGIIAHLDLTEGRVVHVEDHGVRTIPPESGRYEPEHQPALRTDLKPLDITQPEGPSFRIDGYAVSWQKWSFRVGMHPPARPGAARAEL